MPLHRFTNNTATTLGALVDSSSDPATLTVSSFAGFPTGGPFTILIESELMLVTAGWGTTSWTASRAQEGTGKVGHVNGSVVTHIITAYELNSMRQEFNVVAYGAKGDASTNDTTAFQNAVNDAKNSTYGGVVFLPPLSYNIGSALTTYANVVFRTYGAILSGAGASSVTPLVTTAFTGDYTLGAGRLIFGATASKIVPGATSLSLRNNADGADNLLISNAGLATVRAGLTVTASDATLTAGNLVFGAAASRIVPGATSMALRNTANSADNLILTDAGVATIRAGLTVTAGDAAVTAGRLTFAAAASKIVPGATSLSLRNAADSADNILVLDAGTTTIRGSLTISTSGIVIDDVTQPSIQYKIGGTLKSLYGVAGSIGALTPGTAIGDSVFRTQSQVLYFSMDGGTTSHIKFGTTGNIAMTAATNIDTQTAGALSIAPTTANALNLGNATSLVNMAYAATALGGGAAPTFGTIGGSGPATAGQNSWLKVNINGTASFIPIWR